MGAFHHKNNNAKRLEKNVQALSRKFPSAWTKISKRLDVYRENSDVQSAILFHFAHDEGALDRGDVGDVAQVLHDELLIMVHVVGAHLEQVVVGAAGVETFGDLGQTLDAAGEVVVQFAVHLSEFHLAEHREAQPQALGIEYGGIAADVALAFEPALTLKHRRGGQMDGVGEFLCRQFCVLLQRSQQLEVDFVKIVHFSS